MYAESSSCCATCTSRARRAGQRGLSIIELMVGLVVALLVGLAATSSAVMFGATQRQGIGVGGVAVNEIKHWEFETPDPMDTLIGDASYETTSVYGFGHPLYYDNVISTLRGDAQPETDGREGLKSLELLIAMYLSARDGRRVSLPLAY